MSTAISTNVPLIFGNLVTLEQLRVRGGAKGTFLYIISPWVRDVIFPIYEFGISDPDLGIATTLTSQIVGEMSGRGVDVKVCTLHYFSDVLSYKHPLKLDNPADRIKQASRNMEELEVLRDFQSKDALIYLNKNFHSKIIASSIGLYKGSFNFTLSGYYKNREDGFYLSNTPKTREEFERGLLEINQEFFTAQSEASELTLERILRKHEEIIAETRKNWDFLMKKYIKKAARDTEKKISRHGIVV